MKPLPPPGPELVLEVRVAFIRNGLTLTRWCRSNKVLLSNARLALLGGWNGPRGLAMRKRVLTAAGLAEKAAA